MDKIKQIAQRLKELRLIAGKTEQQMAAATLTKIADYAKAESGETDFNLTFMHRCADALGVDVSELISGSAPTLSTYQVVRKGEGLPLEPREGFAYFNLASLKKNKLSQPYLVTAKHSKELENSPVSLTEHDGEEFDFVLKGKLKVQVGGKIELLEEGDCIYYDSSKPHGMVALGQDCDFIALVMHSEPKEFHFPHEIKPLKKETKTDYSKLIYNKFVKVKEDKNGGLLNIEYDYPANFNFGFDVVDAIADKTPDKRAMLWISRDGEELSFSFKDIKTLSNKAANFFKKQGIRKGDKVMLVMQSHHRFWPAVIALHKIGAVAIPATHQLTQKDLEYRFLEAGVTAIVATDENDIPNQVELADANCKCLKSKILINETRNGWLCLEEGIANSSAAFDRPSGKDATTAKDLMLMYFTSGTTGFPKVAAHDFTYPLGHIITARYWQRVIPDGLHYTIADTGWAKFSWGKIYGQWLCEAGIFTYDYQKWDAAVVMPMFKKHNITTFCAPPTMYRFFIKEDLSKYDLSSITHLTTAGEALNAEVSEQFYKATGLKIHEGFGQSEGTPLIYTGINCEPKPGSMGKASPGYDIDIVDADGNSVKTGQPGEIVVRTANGRKCGMFCGYYSAKTNSLDIWKNNTYRTGDVAYRDEDGYYWFVGRADDVIKSSGYRIGPFEVESVIMEIPYILECAVTSTPDPVRGQAVKATIVLIQGKQPSEELKKEIQDYVKKHTAPYKYPRVIEFVQALPKTISGKVKRMDLRNKD